tara:strand:- start:3370 stop:4512 length:1143 start_codon:yes stop_codon:yes gene_type:complete
MKRLLVVVLLFCFFQVSARVDVGEIPVDRPGDDLVWQGIYAFYNSEFEKSVTLLTSAREKFPQHPAVHFTWAVSRWLRTQAFVGIEDSYDVLEKSLDEIIPIYEKYAADYPQIPEYRLYLAASKGLMARMYLGKKEWLGVLVEGVKGYRGVLTVHKENPELWDAYMPIGLLNFFSGNMSPFIQFVAGLFGMEGDRDLGLDQLRVAAEKGEYAWIETSQLLVFIYLWMDDDYDEALRVTEMLVRRLPDSIYNQHLYTETLIRLNRLDEAEANLALTYNMAQELPPLSREGWIPTLKYHEALLNFYSGNYDKAMEMITQSIDEFATELDTPLGFGYVLRGQIHDLRGERRQAVADYRAALMLDNYSSAMDKARACLRFPYSE